MIQDVDSVLWGQQWDGYEVFFRNKILFKKIPIDIKNIVSLVSF